MNLFKRRNARTMMEDPDVAAARAGADAAYRDYTDPERRNENLLRRFGGGTGTSQVAPGTIIAMAPDLPNRVMTGVNEPGVSKVRTIGNEIVQPSDTRWSGEQVQGFMGTPPAKPAMASAQIPGSVAEQLLGPVGGRGQRSEVRGQGSPQPETVNREPGTLFYDENPIQTSANQPKQFQKMQADYWTNNVFAKARNARTGFATLAEYDAWFRSLPGNPGELGPTMKDAYLAGMPPNIQQEFMEGRMRATTERREAPAAAAFSAAADLKTPIKTMAEAEAAGKGQQMKIRGDENVRSQRQLEAYERQVTAQEQSGELTREEKDLQLDNIRRGQAEIDAAVKKYGSLEAIPPIMSADGKFYRNVGDIDKANGAYRWKPYSPWSFSEELGAELRAGGAGGVPAIPGPDVTGATTPPPGAGKKLDAQTAQRFMQQAGGDKAKARELARQAGYTF